jgi:hypothetical protein
VELVDGGGVGDAVRAHFSRVVRLDLYSGPNGGPHHNRFFREDPHDEILEGRGEGRNDARERRAGDLLEGKTRVLEKRFQQHVVLVLEVIEMRRDSPVGDPFAVRVDPDHGLGVADVENEEHEGILLPQEGS